MNIQTKTAVILCISALSTSMDCEKIVAPINSSQIERAKLRAPSVSADVKLAVDRTIEKQLVVVTLTNSTPKGIALPYEYVNVERNRAFVPYHLECKLKKESLEVMSPEFHFVPKLQELSSGEELTFEINIPEIAHDCSLRVGYYSDLQAIVLVNEKVFNLSHEEEGFLSESERQSQISFR